MNYYIKTYKENHLLNENVKEIIQPIINTFYPIILRSKLLFPNKKFLIYDSGKLNRLLSLVI